MEEDSGGAVTGDTAAGGACGAVVDVAAGTASASFCDTFPTAAFGEDWEEWEDGGAVRC